MSTKLDASQAIQLVTDEVNDALRVNLVAGAGAGGSSVPDQTTFVPGSTGVNPSGGVFDDGLAAVPSGDVATERITPNRAVHTNLRNNAGTEIATASNPLRNDPTGTTPQPASQSGTWNINNVSGTVSLPTNAAQETGGNLASIKTNQTNGTQTSIVTQATAGNLNATIVGTVTANAGTNLNTSALALSANQTNKTQYSRITDGTNDVSVTAGNALKVDASATTQPISGTVTANAGTGNFTVVQPTGTNLHTVIDSGTLTTVSTVTAVTSITNPVTVAQATAANLNATVIGTVTANAGTNLNTSALSTSANQVTELTRLSGSLVPTAYDEIDLTYVPSGNGAGQIATAVYKLATVTQKTLTLTYDASNRLTSVVAS